MGGDTGPGNRALVDPEVEAVRRARRSQDAD
jgi:hypothetical protein